MTHSVCLHRLQYPGYAHFQDTVLKWTQRNLVFHIPAYIINAYILVSDIPKQQEQQQSVQNETTVASSGVDTFKSLIPLRVLQVEKPDFYE